MTGSSPNGDGAVGARWLEYRRGWEARAQALHRAFVVRRLSPGGAADLLAATLFVHALHESDGA